MFFFLYIVSFSLWICVFVYCNYLTKFENNSRYIYVHGSISAKRFSCVFGLEDDEANQLIMCCPRR